MGLMRMSAVFVLSSVFSGAVGSVSHACPAKGACNLQIEHILLQRATTFSLAATERTNSSASINELVRSSGSADATTCCQACGEKGFCSPVSKQCYDSKKKDYYLRCRANSDADETGAVLNNPCLEECPCWYSYAGAHTCANRIQWIEEHSTNGDRTAAARQVFEEFRNVCFCAPTPAPTPAPRCDRTDGLGLSSNYPCSCGTSQCVVGNRCSIENGCFVDDSDIFTVKIASVNLQTPEAGQFDKEKKVMAAHIDTFFRGVEIYAWQETKANGFGGLRKGGDLVAKEIHRDVFGDDDNYKWIFPTEAFGGNIEDTNCDSSIMYDSSIWSLEKNGSARTVTDRFDTRTVVWGVFSKADGLVAIFNTHATWGSSTGGQFDSIRGEIDKVIEEFPGINIILVGDFNNKDWWNFKVTPPLRKPDQATGGNMGFDWVLTTPTPEEPNITYGKIGNNQRALHTGSDHEPVLIEVRFARSNVIQA